MIGVIVTLQLLMIGGLVVLAYEIADVQKRIKHIDEEIADVHGQQAKQGIVNELAFSDMQNKLLELREDVAGISSQPELSEDSDSFAQRIEEIKNELGLKVQIADAHKKGTEAVSFHPGVYNIAEDEVRATYQGNQGDEYAR